MDPKHTNTQLDWLNQQRLKDIKHLAEMEEQLKAIAPIQNKMDSRMSHLESELAQVRSLAVKSGEFREMLDRQRADFMQRLDGSQVQRTTSERELEHLRQLEREAVSRSLSELKNNMESLAQIQQELLARREDTERLTRSLTEVQKNVETLSRGYEQVETVSAHMQAQRRQDTRRVDEISTEAETERRILAELKAKMDAVQDLVMRSDARMVDLAALEHERNATQTAWTEKQMVIRAEQDNLLKHLQSQAVEVKSILEELPRRLETFAQEHGEMRRTLSTFSDQLERSELMMGEASEAQRLSREQLRDEWDALMAAEEKKWNVHATMRDEHWRQHDQRHATADERIIAAQSSADEARATLRSLLATDHKRLKEIHKLIREFMVEHDKPLKKTH